MENDEIGCTIIKLTSLCTEKGIDEWFELEHEGKKAGTIHLKSEFTPVAAPVTKVEEPIRD